jgi:uncharacterized Fe-S cluster-containing radical SAM superfamily protein
MDEARERSLEEIREILRSTKITAVQLDPNAICGSACWFCPVRYYKRTAPNVMSPDEFEAILGKISLGIEGGFIEPNFTLWLSSYNDILLDPNLKSRLDALRQRRWRFTVLTNGVGLLPSIDLLNRYKDVIAGYLVNLPAGNAEDYAKFTKNSPETFDKIVQGLRDLYNRDPGHYERVITITVNGAFDDKHARLQLNYDLPIGDTDKQIRHLKFLFPDFNVHEARPLCDRAGLLKDAGVIDNTVMPIREWWKLPVGSNYATGCNGGGDSTLGRLSNWLHVSSTGRLYSCCQDFLEFFDYGSLLESDLDDLIYSEDRVEAVRKSLRNMCTRCWFSR